LPACRETRELVQTPNEIRNLEPNLVRELAHLVTDVQSER
jgi:hypothetical protein